MFGKCIMAQVGWVYPIWQHNRVQLTSMQHLHSSQATRLRPCLLLSKAWRAFAWRLTVSSQRVVQFFTGRQAPSQ